MTTLSWVSVFTNDTITRAAFITNLRTRIDEDIPDAITDVQIQKLIDAGLRDISYRTKMLPEYCEVTPDASASYTLPAGLVQIREVIYIDAATPANYNMVTKTNLEELEQTGYTTTSMTQYVRDGNTIAVFGSTVSVGTLRVYGTRIPTVPVEDTDNIDLPQQYLELLYLWCEWHYWRRRREADEASLSRELYLLMAKNVAEEVIEEYEHGVTFYGKGN